MKAVFMAELKRAFKNKIFLAVVGTGVILSVLAFFNTPGWKLCRYWMDYTAGDSQALALADMMKFVDTPLAIWMPGYGVSSKYYYFWIIILPILCVLPYGTTYLQDKSKGFINQLVTRSGKSKYYLSKLIVCFLNGGSVAVIPLISNLLLCMCFLPWGMPLRITSTYPVGDDCVFSGIFYSRPALYVVIYLFFTFVLFGLISCLCLFLSFWIDNLFALTIAPFVIYYAEHVLVISNHWNFNLSIINNTDFFIIMDYNMWLHLIILAVLLLLDLSFLIRIKKDIL